MCKKIPVCPPSRAGAGSRKKIPGAGAAPKQAGSEILVETHIFLILVSSVEDPDPYHIIRIRIQQNKFPD